MTKLFSLHREVSRAIPGGEGCTLGKLYLNNIYFCETCEDEDRFLETGKEKVYGRTAIPRGRYRLVVTLSSRFGKELPEVLAVPGFSGVRLHGGNRAEDSLGCILVGRVRTATGIAQCADTVARITAVVKAAAMSKEDCYLEVV